MVIGARVVDAATGNSLTLGQSIGRYLACIVSMVPLCLGLFSVGFDGRKQGWHDKLAGTVVVRSKKRGVEAVSFRRPDR
ncbi:RDD family protein [Paracidovorax valerianellae]|nr:RDD family protein [Paracidovorax valerianellae]MDA8443622.1 RDD family protein [Paracidovorax valerianellae]